MKKLIILYCLSCLVGCNDDFLDSHKKQQVIYAETPMYISPTTEIFQYSYCIPEAKNANYTIGVIPKWINIKYQAGKFKNDSVSFKFTVQNIPVTSTRGTYRSSLTLNITDLGMVYVIPVFLVNE